ncbi:MAG: CinA family protein, partial [Alphaproteobacteria bacterium]
MLAELKQSASDLLDALRAQGLMLAAAESCTGGLISACLTEIPGSSDVLERGFVTYSNAAKTEMLGVPPEMIESNGAVSEEVAGAMASGALTFSKADISVAVTGIAGPGGGSDDKPVGLVHL